MQAQKRNFDPYELNQLRKYGLNPNQFSADIQTPVEYLTGHVQFRQLDLLVTPDVLIPRVETEELVDLILRYLHSLPATSNLKIADVGTGSGAIGLSLALEFGTRVEKFSAVLGDISPTALDVARKNAENVLSDDWLDAQVQLVQSDLLNRFPPGPYNVIVANLPYIPTSRIPSLDASVTEFEPHLALDGGEDGLDLIAQLLDQVSDYLADDGLIFLEIDDSHTAGDLQQLAPDFAVEIIKDSADKTRFARLWKKEVTSDEAN